MKVIILVVVLFLVSSCKEQDTKGNLNKSNQKNIETKGTVIDSLEVGFWETYREEELIQEGLFDKGLRTGLWKYRLSYGEEAIDWKIYQAPSLGVKINHPNGWEIQDKEKDEAVMFLAVADEKELFVVERYNKEKAETDLKNYVRYMVKIATESKDEHLEDYTLKRIVFRSRNTYFFEFRSTVETTDYRVYSIYTEDADYIYDFMYRTIDGDNKELKHQIFVDMVYSVFLDGTKLFYNHDYIKESKVITSLDLEDI